MAKVAGELKGGGVVRFERVVVRTVEGGMRMGWRGVVRCVLLVPREMYVKMVGC